MTDNDHPTTIEKLDATRQGQSLTVEPEAQTQLAITPMQMLQMAVEQGADLDKMQKLMELQERWEANESRKAYMRAMAAFKANPPDLIKTKRVRYETQKGITDYTHAELDQISAAIGSALSKHNLSHSWKTDQLDGGVIRVTCVITHELGHSESVSLQAGADQTGSKNSIQAIGSSVTYLQRYTLLAATGLAAKGQDTDATDVSDIERISEEQVADLNSLIEETGANEHKFLKHMQAQSLDRIRADQYDRAVAALENYRRKAAAKESA